ncbi:MAG: hypothetical protein R3B93_00250 [Bacteroidia bacterium]
MATKEFVRAAIGGTGSAKAAGNYAASLLPDKIANLRVNVIFWWLDAAEYDWQYIEECGTMNVFFVIGDTVVAPRLNSEPFWKESPATVVSNCRIQRI